MTEVQGSVRSALAGRRKQQRTPLLVIVEVKRDLDPCLGALGGPITIQLSSGLPSLGYFWEVMAEGQGALVSKQDAGTKG